MAVTKGSSKYSILENLPAKVPNKIPKNADIKKLKKQR